MPGYSYIIDIKDSSSRALAKISKQSALTDLAMRKTLGNIKKGGKDAVPSIDSLRTKIGRLTTQRDAAFSASRIKKFNKEIRKAERALRRLENLPPLSIRDRFRNLRSSISSSILPLGGVAAGVAVVGYSLRSVVTTGIQFNKEMSNVQALTGASSTELNALIEAARKMGASTSFSAKEAAEGMGFLAMAGFNTNQIIAATPATLALAAAGSISLGEAADTASNVLSQFGLEAEQTGRVSDVMAKTITTSNTNMREMSEAMKFLGPTAKALGVGLEESSATLGILANSGIKGSLASRALGSAFTRLAKPTSVMQQSMKALKVDFFEEGEFVGVAGAVGKLEGALAGMTQEQRAAHLSTLFGNEAFQEVSILMDEGADKIRQYTDELRDSRGIAKEIADTKLDNLAGDWTKLKSVVSELAIGFYNQFRPALRSITQGLIGMTKGFVAVGKWIVRNSGWIKGLTAGVVAYNLWVKRSIILTRVAAVTKALWGKVTAALTVKQWALNVAMSANPIGLMIGAVAALTVGYLALRRSIHGVSAAQKAQMDVKSQTRSNMIEEQTEANTLIEIFKHHTSSVEQRTAAYNKLNELYPDILGKYDSEKIALENIDLAQESIIKNIERRSRAEATHNLLTKAQEDLRELKENGRSLYDQIQRFSPAAAFGGDSFTKKVKALEDRVKRLSKLSFEALREDIGSNEELTLKKTKEVEVNTTEETNTSIITGGKRQQIFNIQIDKVLETVNQNISEGRDTAEDAVDQVLDGLTRRLHGTFRTLAQ